ncbi:FtsK/SpoIIIE domain-containing protein, partial [Cellulomonas algicola]|uniref:FtsK/SpoIIIE domain-containing protein n=1 Tax=Cellulomonas algicola TaxID=2071633 RepID=UPI0022A69195
MRRRTRTLPPGRWVRWRAGHLLVTGRASLALRVGPPPWGEDDGPDGTGHPERERGRGDAEQVVTWLAPLAGSVALALVLRQPALLLVGLVVPLVGLGVHLARRRRRRGAADGAGHRRDGTDRSAHAYDHRHGHRHGHGHGYGLGYGLGYGRGHGDRDGDGDEPDGPTPAPERVPRDPADLTFVTTAATLGRGGRVRGGVPWSADGCLAVVGNPQDAAATARAVVLAELGSHAAADLVVVSRRPDGWGWTAPVEPREPLPAPGDPGTVVVCDDPATLGRLAVWRAGAPGRHRLLLVLGRRADVPAWCRHVLEVAPDGARLHAGGAAPAVVPWHAVTAERARAQLLRARTLRELAGARPPVAAPPAHVALGDLPGVPAARPDAVLAAWSTAGTGLVARLGRGAGGEAVTVDLVTDGPHALVAGTTGAGKSELLTTLVLALALTHGPERLAVLLVDFKGGTGLGAVAGLPHVLDHVTDLDAARTQRVLAGLRAESRRRERVLAARGAHDVADLDPRDAATPPRLLVVVDELRALADDVPDAVATLARLAAQGRALGIHLVLATQRPAGVVTADLRANVELRVALRVADDADSRDVVDDPGAARLDPRTPGRAVLRRGSLPTEVVQVARPRPGTGA